MALSPGSPLSPDSQHSLDTDDEADLLHIRAKKRTDDEGGRPAPPAVKWRAVAADDDQPFVIVRTPCGVMPESVLRVQLPQCVTVPGSEGEARQAHVLVRVPPGCQPGQSFRVVWDARLLQRAAQQGTAMLHPGDAVAPINSSGEGEGGGGSRGSSSSGSCGSGSSSSVATSIKQCLRVPCLPKCGRGCCPGRHNEHITSVLDLISKYESAAGGQDDIKRDGRDAYVNSRALAAARAIASLCAEDAPLIPTGPCMSDALAGQLRQRRFVGGTWVKCIQEIMASAPSPRTGAGARVGAGTGKGTCDKLERHLRDEPLLDSSGCPRQERGGFAKHELSKVLGVGLRSASLLYDHGIRSVAQLTSHLDRCLSSGGKGSIVRKPRRVRAALAHHDELMRGVSHAEIERMQIEILSAAERALPSDSAHQWVCEAVGGTRRAGPLSDWARGARHDADFLISYRPRPHAQEARDDDWADWIRLEDCHGTDGVLHSADGIVAQLKSRGFLSPDWENVQVANSRAYYAPWQMNKEEAVGQVMRGHYNMDKFERYFGVWLSLCSGASGEARKEWRRVDIVLVPAWQYGYALLGWTGSKMYNRFCRQYARQLGLMLNNHCMVKRVDDEGHDCKHWQDARIFPTEIQGHKYEGLWPVTERAIVEQLLEMPYLEPHERNM